jgi:hypothetical protein
MLISFYRPLRKSSKIKRYQWFWFHILLVNGAVVERAKDVNYRVGT